MQVKEVIVAAIGGIGLPEALPCTEHLVKHMRKAPNNKPAPWSDQPQVKCMAIWALGRLACTKAIRRAHDVILSGLADPYFKVRSAACTTIAQMGTECSETQEFAMMSQQALPVLQKLLKDG